MGEPLSVSVSISVIFPLVKDSEVTEERVGRMKEWGSVRTSGRLLRWDVPSCLIKLRPVANPAAPACCPL